MGTGAIDVRRFFHGFALGAAVSPFGYFTTTDGVFAFFGRHFVSSSIESLSGCWADNHEQLAASL
jgi:hypothetical protein